MRRLTDIDGNQVFAGDFLKRINGIENKPSTHKPYWQDFKIVGNVIDNPEMYQDYGVTPEMAIELTKQRLNEL